VGRENERIGDIIDGEMRISKKAPYKNGQWGLCPRRGGCLITIRMV